MAMQKECRTHGLVEHRRHKSGKGREAWRCPACVSAAVIAHKQKRKRILMEEAGGACVLCGYDRCSRSLHFHHLDPTTKLFNLHGGLTGSLESLRQEARKCVLVCANCHGEVEAGLVQV